MLKSTERFSSRVENYALFRPSYPAGVIDLLQSHCTLSSSSAVADLGSGTGILTALLLKTGATVFAVEPNPQMRRAAEDQLGAYQGFHSVNGTAEATTLSAHGVDIIVAAQAFHWFDVPRARCEALRVGRNECTAALIWNERPTNPGAFLADYDALLRRHAAEYAKILSERIDVAKISEFFAGKFELATFANAQRLAFQGLRGRLMSSSYAPEAGHPQHEPMLDGLQELYARHAQDGAIDFPYQTLVYFGRLR